MQHYTMHDIVMCCQETTQKIDLPCLTPNNKKSENSGKSEVGDANRFAVERVRMTRPRTLRLKVMPCLPITL